MRNSNLKTVFKFEFLTYFFENPQDKEKDYSPCLDNSLQKDRVIHLDNLSTMWLFQANLSKVILPFFRRTSKNS